MVFYSKVLLSLKQVKLVTDSKNKDRQHNKWQDISEIGTHPTLETRSLTGIGFIEETLQAPSIPACAEQTEHHAAQRQKAVRNNKIFKVENGAAKSTQPIP